MKVDKTQLQRVRDQLPRASNGISGWTLTCYQALFSFRSVKHSGRKGETKNRA